MSRSTRWTGVASALLGSLIVAPDVGAAATTRYDPHAKREYGQIFTQVLQKFIGSRAGLNICLPPMFGFGDTVSETAEVNLDHESTVAGVLPGSGRLDQFRALEKAGLVTSTESTRTAGNRTLHFAVFRRTSHGVAVSQGPSICYARGELDRIVKWKGPVALGEYQAAFVYYTVKTTRIEDWARSAEVQAAFPTVLPILKGEDAAVRQVVIDLSSEGWDVAEYSKYLQMQ